MPSKRSSNEDVRPSTSSVVQFERTKAKPPMKVSRGRLLIESLWIHGPFEPVQISREHSDGLSDATETFLDTVHGS
jgi:hypothetical protein